jgi:hypothetical protein
MNRRHFFTAMGATAAAASLIRVNGAFAAETTTSFYVKGLIMVSFEDSKVLRLGLPKAPGHKATLALVPQTGSQRSLSLKGGTYAVETAAKVLSKPEYKIPELVRMQELHGNGIRSRVNECPTVISIPYGAIKSITTADVSPDRYTFVRSDNGEEIITFRPRKVADTLRIELSSDAVLKMENGKSVVAMNTMKEVHTEYSPDTPITQAEIDMFSEHFTHYYGYLDQPAGAKFLAVPKVVGGKSAPTPNVGHHFVAPFPPFMACYVIGV